MKPEGVAGFLRGRRDMVRTPQHAQNDEQASMIVIARPTVGSFHFASIGLRVRQIWAPNDLDFGLHFGNPRSAASLSSTPM